MLPLLPILLIAKLSIALPAAKGGMKKTELDKYVENIRLNYPAQFQLDTSAGLLVAIHTFLVLLQASIEKFEGKSILDPQANVEVDFPDIILVASFKSEQLEWLNKSTTIIKETKNDGPLDVLATMLQEDYPENLEPCFTRLNNLPDDFNIIDCLADCLNSAPVLSPEILKDALKLGLDILSSADLQQAKSWTKEQNALTNTRSWLLKRVNLPNDLTAQLNAIDDARTRMILHQNRAMLVESSKFYKETISRLKNPDGGNDIAAAISRITEQSNAVQKKTWEDLQNALYGVISWHMYYQARYAANQIQYILKTLD